MSETREMLIYGAETIEWAIDRARQHSIEKWADALKLCEGIDIRAARHEHSYTITPEYLQGLANSLRMRAEDLQEGE